MKAALPVICVLCVCAVLLSGCAGAAAGGKVSLARGATVDTLDTSATSAPQSPRIERAGTVQTTYGALDANTARMFFLGALIWLALLCAAVAAPSPAQTSVVIGLYVAAGASVIVAVFLAWTWFL